MATRMIEQTNFFAGQVDTVNWRRAELPAYLSACQRAENMEVAYTGLLRKRRGTTRNIKVAAQDGSQFYSLRDNNANYYLIVGTALAFKIYDVATFTLQATLVSPYSEADLASIDYDSVNDTIVLTHGDYPPAQIYITNYSPLTFAYRVLPINPYPTYDFGKIDYSNMTVTIGVVGNILTFTLASATDPGFTNDWIGGVIIGGGASVEQFIGYARITAVSYGAGLVTFTATVYVPFETTNYITKGSGYSIQQPAFSATLGWPWRVCNYQNRVWYANTKSLPTGIFGSKIKAFDNFDVATGSDVDAIVFIIGQSDSGAITALNGGKQFEVYTENYEFVCPQAEDSALTPSTFSIRQQSSFGSTFNAQPVSYLNDSYFIASSGTSIINFRFQGVGLAYMATNVSSAAQSLVRNPVQRALQRATNNEQSNYIYYLNSDSSIISFQFNSEFRDKNLQFGSLTPLTFAQDIEVLDIISINNVVYFLKKYPLTGIYTIEHFDSTYKLDGTIQATMNSVGVVTGLSDFNGYTVNAFFQGQDFGRYEVEGGEITVFNPLGLSGAISIGILYDTRVVPMFIYYGAQGVDMMKKITRVFVDYYQSLNFEVNGQTQPYLNFLQIQDSNFLPLQDGTAIVNVVRGYERNGTIEITQSSPYDLTIVAIRYQAKAVII